MSGAQYYWSDNEERWGHGPFDTREEAVASALDSDLEPGQTFWTGIRNDVLDQLSVDADCILERLADNAYELVGDAVWGDGWPTTDGTSQAEELGKEIWKLVRAYLEKHDPPSFWVIGDEETHTTPGGPE